MTETAELLFINDAFYHVFRTRDATAMDGLWALGEPVACIHPGWHALTTREDVMDSWRGILSNPDSPHIACRGARAHMIGEVGFVICYEVIDGSVLVATNVFARENGVWKLVHHQAGPCNTPPAELEEEAEEGSLQ